MSKNKKIYFYILGVITIVLLLVIFSPTTTKAQLGGNEFLSLSSKTADSIIIDVRTPEEFNAGHIDTSINVDFENPNFKSEIAKLDKDKTYFIYCRSGNRSGQALDIMKQEGINKIYDLQGGIVSNTNSIKLISS